MHIHFIETGFFSTDGGAMFGLLPKMIWNKYYPCDEQNRCNLSMRAILIEIEDRKILIDAGCGLSDDSRMGGYGFTNRIDPASAIAQIGIGKEEITDIILSHLHFDHCGGIFEEKSGKLQGIFPFATIHVSKDQLNQALRPSPLDEDAFFEEQIQEIKNASTLNLIDRDCELYPGIEIKIYNGHTPGQLAVFIRSEQNEMVYGGDIIPTHLNLRPEGISGFDIMPMESYLEKMRFLEEVYRRNAVLLFYHDAYMKGCKIKKAGTKRFLPVKHIL